MDGAFSALRIDGISPIEFQTANNEWNELFTSYECIIIYLRP